MKFSEQLWGTGRPSLPDSLPSSRRCGPVSPSRPRSAGFVSLVRRPAGLPSALWLLGTLAGALGLAVVAASSLTPLVQAWLARAGAGAASADPYFLYSASNAGSAGALLAYPFLLEPFLALSRQEWAWSAALLGLAPFLLVLWMASVRGRAASPAVVSEASGTPAALPVAPIPRFLPASAGMTEGRILALSGYGLLSCPALGRREGTDTRSRAPFDRT